MLMRMNAVNAFRHALGVVDRVRVEASWEGRRRGQNSLNSTCNMTRTVQGYSSMTTSKTVS